MPVTRRELIQLSACLSIAHAASSRSVAVIAHRGEHLRNPENSIAGIQSAAAMGVDFVEVDVRTTKDGKLVLMHDSTTARTTGVAGDIGQMTLAEIRGLRLKGGGNVPTFDEALEVLKPARTGVYLDAKQIAAADITRILGDHSMLERTVVYGSPTLLHQIAAQGPHPRVMPEARSVEVLRKLLVDLKPSVVAFDHRDWTDDIIAVAKKGGVKDLFVDRLGPNDTSDEWEAAVRRGATGIQTDHPEMLIRWLSSRK